MLALGRRKHLLYIAAHVGDEPLDTRPDLLAQGAELIRALHHDRIDRAVLRRREVQLSRQLVPDPAPFFRCR